jgi:N-acetylglucosaminyl-diphospho-decaprenol L-rhamnosyltransferase
MRRPIVGLVLNYRDADRTIKCIGSLLNDGIEHVLVWDNSEDENVSGQTIRTRLKQEARVTVEISSRNLGFAAGVNRGLEWIRQYFPETWILLINNDAVLLTGAINALTQALIANPDAVIAYPTIDHAGRLVGPAYYQRHFGLITTKKLLGSVLHASGCCQLLATERLEGAWFDEDFFMYGEDVELGWRLGINRMVHVSEVWVMHEGSASSKMGSPFYETSMVAAHWLLTRKLARSRLEFALLWLGRAAFLPLRALLRSWRYRSWIPIKSFPEGWRLIHRSS